MNALSERLEAAHDDVSMVVDGYDLNANRWVTEDAPTELALLAVLGQPVAAPNGTPLLRTTTGAVPLVQVLVFGEPLDDVEKPCDRCAADEVPAHSLWVSAGGSIVAIHCCGECRASLDGSFDGLVWR